MTTEESQVRAQALLDSWTRTGSEMRNTIAWRDVVALEIKQAFARGQADMRMRLAALLRASDLT
jgi:hypothetical protein